MALINKTNNFLGRYNKIVPITKMLAPVFNALFYISVVFIGLILIISFIVMMVKVDVRDMLLPPHMNEIIENDAIISYSLKLGNGLKITSDASEITLSHIKLVIYSKLAMLELGLIVITPIFRLLALLFKNIGKKQVLNEENAMYINYIGFIILIGNTLFTILNNIFNFLQVKKFMSGIGEKINYSFDLEWFGIIIGIFIIIVGTIYGYACSIKNEEIKQITALSIHEDD